MSILSIRHRIQCHCWILCDLVWFHLDIKKLLKGYVNFLIVRFTLFYVSLSRWISVVLFWLLGLCVIKCMYSRRSVNCKLTNLHIQSDLLAVLLRSKPLKVCRVVPVQVSVCIAHDIHLQLSCKCMQRNFQRHHTKLEPNGQHFFLTIDSLTASFAFEKCTPRISVEGLQENNFWMVW